MSAIPFALRVLLDVVGIALLVYGLALLMRGDRK